MSLSGAAPFWAATDREVLGKVRQGRYSLAGPRWYDVSTEAKDCISSLMKFDPHNRLSATVALAHPWVAGRGGLCRPR